MSKKAVKTVSVSDLTKGDRIQGVMLRHRIRQAGIKKPGTNWVWPVNHKDLKVVRKLAK